MNEIIEQRLAEYQAAQSTEMANQVTRSQERLKVLVEKYGLTYVAQAGELTVGTLKQYISLKRPPAINIETVNKAEKILEGL